MDIKVFSRTDARDFTSDKPWAVVSIATNDGDWPKLNKCQQMGILQLHFADADHEVFMDRLSRMEIAMFEEYHANKILDFVNEMWDKVEVFVFHCEGGISRSAAVAAAITKIKGGDDSIWFKIKSPNALVYRTILETANKRGEFGPVDASSMPKSQGVFRQ